MMEVKQACCRKQRINGGYDPVDLPSGRDSMPGADGWTSHRCPFPSCTGRRECLQTRHDPVRPRIRTPPHHDSIGGSVQTIRRYIDASAHRIPVYQCPDEVDVLVWRGICIGSGGPLPRGPNSLSCRQASRDHPARPCRRDRRRPSGPSSSASSWPGRLSAFFSLPTASAKTGSTAG